MLRRICTVPLAGRAAASASASAAAAPRLSSAAAAAFLRRSPPVRHSHIRLRPTLDLRAVRDHAAAVQQNLTQRGSAEFASAHRVADLYEQSLAREFEVAQVRKQRNAVSKKFSTVKSKEERDALTAEGAALKQRLVTLEADLDALNATLESEALRLPNSTSPLTPIGPEGSGRVIKVVGAERTQAKSADQVDHVAFCARWQLLDQEAGSTVCGSRFVFLAHELALLELALIQWSVSFLVSRGWTPVLPPDLIRSSFVSACGFQPRDVAGSTSQVYAVEGTDLSLAGTAEIPLAAMHSGSTLDPSDLPRKVVGFGHAFRTEAGGSGLAIRGLYRVHQFSKVEMFALCTPEQDEALFAEMLALQEEMYSALGLAFRVLEIPSEDLGAPAHRKVDCEAWMPGRGTAGEFGEISSSSQCTDYQSRRLGIRLTAPDPRASAASPSTSADSSRARFAHTLNGTAAAIPRLMIAILEQHQSADGRSVAVPECLRPFMMNCASIPDRKLFPQRKEVQPTVEQPVTTKTAGKAKNATKG